VTNYQFAFVAGQLTVTPAPLIASITANDKTYDGTPEATIATANLSGVIGADDVSLTGGTATFADKHFVTGKLVTTTGLGLTGAQAANYSVNDTATTSANISTRP